VVTAANIADSAALPDLLHGDETKVWGDQAYRGQSEAIREGAPRAQDLTNQRYRYKNRLDEVEREKSLRLMVRDEYKNMGRLSEKFFRAFCRVDCRLIFAGPPFAVFLWAASTGCSSPEAGFHEFY
jgi:hypothetical protein